MIVNSPIRPPAWLRHSTAAVFSPSSPGIARFPQRTNRARGIFASALEGSVVIPPAAAETHGYRTSSPSKAAAELERLARDPQVRIIISAIGGFNTNSILSELDWEVFRRFPTIFCGYSDATALLLALYARSGLVTLHGPALLPQWGDPKGPLPETSSIFLDIVRGESVPLTLTPSARWALPIVDWSNDSDSIHDKLRPSSGWRVLIPGHACGRLIGGNVETLNMLMGTDCAITEQGAIVFLEATGAEAYLPRMHRAMIHLRDSGLLENPAGLIIGRCPDLRSEEGVELSDVVYEVLRGRNIPTLLDVEIGHTEPILTLPIGVLAEIHADPEKPRLILSEPAVMKDKL